MKHKRTIPKIFTRAQELRHNQTEAETKLWAYLRSHRLDEVGFRRQHAIGNYIVDFCAPPQKLIIELDGSQHLGSKSMTLNGQPFSKLKAIK